MYIHSLEEEFGKEGGLVSESPEGGEGLEKKGTEWKGEACSKGGNGNGKNRKGLQVGKKKKKRGRPVEILWRQ